MNKNYDLRTHNLIEKIKELNLRQIIPFEQDKIVECLKKIDVILGRKKIKEVKRITNFKDLTSSASSAYGAYGAAASAVYGAYGASAVFTAYGASVAYGASAASAVYGAYGASAVSVAYGASAAYGASSASAVYAAYGAYAVYAAYGAYDAYGASDYNFREFIFSFEWNLENKGKGNKNDEKFLEIQQLLLQCKEYGLGYAFRDKDILYLFSAPIIQLKNNRYHSTDKPAIYFDDDNKFYYIEGIKFEKSEWEDIVSGKLSIKEILMWTNTEKQRAAMSVISTERFITELNPKEINRNERGDILFEVKGILPKPVRIAKYKDWSTERIYVKFVRPEFNTIDEVLAQKHNVGLAEWINGLHS